MARVAQVAQVAPELVRSAVVQELARSAQELARSAQVQELARSAQVQELARSAVVSLVQAQAQAGPARGGPAKPRCSGVARSRASQDRHARSRQSGQ